MLFAEILSEPHRIWLAVGFLGQFLFFMRFFVQWVASERAGKSVMPEAFWYFSILGGFVLFMYAVFALQDPVFTLGQGAGLLIYTRNIYFIHGGKKVRAAGSP
jgi:lipid-A-disaccharide synthase-like uncharacterized protein